MGLGYSCPQHVIDLAIVAKIELSKFGGQGLVATEDIPAGTLLVEDQSTNNSRKLKTFMNDADLQYPETFTIEELLGIFTNYTNREFNSLCNTTEITNADDTIKKYRVIHYIRKGEEITRRYGMGTWACFILTEVTGIGFCPRETSLDLQEIYNNLEIVYRNFGYKFTLTNLNADIPAIE